MYSEPNQWTSQERTTLGQEWTCSLADPRCPGVPLPVADYQFRRDPGAVSFVRHQNPRAVHVFPLLSASYAKTRASRPRPEVDTPRPDDLHADQTAEGLPSTRRREWRGQKRCRDKGATAEPVSARRLDWIEPAILFLCRRLRRHSCLLKHPGAANFRS